MKQSTLFRGFKETPELPEQPESAMDMGDEQPQLNVPPNAARGRWISKVAIRSMLEHNFYKYFIVIVALANLIVIILQTENRTDETYVMGCTVSGYIIFTIFLCEILLKIYCDFKSFWKIPWNVIDFMVAMALLILAMKLPKDGVSIVILKCFQSLRFFKYNEKPSMILKVIKDSFADMGDIILLFALAVWICVLFGVSLFGTMVPSAFVDFPTGLYTLFICFTQDGWTSIYRLFHGDVTAAVYFMVYIMTVIMLLNLFDSVFANNLTRVFEMDETSPQDTFSTLNEEHVTVHAEEGVGETNIHMKGLTEEKLFKMFMLRQAMFEKKQECSKILKELKEIVDRTNNLPANRELIKEMLQRGMAAKWQKKFLGKKLEAARSGDLLSTLIDLKKANIIDSKEALLYETGSLQEGLRRASVAAVAERASAINIVFRKQQP